MIQSLKTLITGTPDAIKALKALIDPNVLQASNLGLLPDTTFKVGTPATALLVIPSNTPEQTAKEIVNKIPESKYKQFGKKYIVTSLELGANFIIEEIGQSTRK